MRIIDAFIGAGTAMLMALSATVASAELKSARVWHVEKIKTFKQVYQSQTQCSIQRVPVYGYVTTPPNNGDVLIGAIIGGLFGGTVSGKDEGAAIGAVLGATVAGNQNKTSSRVTGYTNQEVCNEVSVPVNVEENQNIIHWKRGNRRGYFYTYNDFKVGDQVWVDVP